MRILMIGDVVGKPGRNAIQALVPGLRQEHNVDLVIANGENSAGGFGITPGTAQELFNAGADVITTGDHIWDKQEIIPYLDDEKRLLRPINFPADVPGIGHYSIGNVMVVNLMGRTFMRVDLDSPFKAMDALLDIASTPPVIVVDFHAEATSEKQAMGWYLDGRVSAVVGTHTHVATADHRVLSKGTAFVSDLGMVGPMNSVIGDEVEDVLTRFLYQMPRRLRVAGGPVRFNSVLVDVDEETGRASDIKRVDRIVGGD